MNNYDSDIFIRLGELIDRGGIYEQRTGDDEVYQQFRSQYPAETLADLSIDQYCMGLNSIPQNFCWWLERGLEKVLGRYSPGSARGHMLYKDKDGSIYRNRKLEHLEPDAALSYTLSIHSLIANVDPTSDFGWIDSDSELFRRAGVDDLVAIGNARKLRVLAVYHPDDILPMSSADHLGHFLKELGVDEAEIPDRSRSAARLIRLTEFYSEAKSRFNSKLTPYGFMRALYSEELAIKPIKIKERITVKLSEGAVKNGYIPLPARTGMFPSQYIGGGSADDLGEQFTLNLPNGESIKTDVRGEKGNADKAGRVRARMGKLFELEGVKAGDRVTISFVGEGVYDAEFIEEEVIEVVSESKTEGVPSKASASINQILYGPPGTGKTYQTINKAVEILDPEFYAQNIDDREAIKQRYDELSGSERVGFVTFHQSFSYEDFVEGLKAQTNEQGSISYDVEDGIFKSICSLAKSSVAKGVSKSVDLSGVRVWKMSLGNTLKDDTNIFDECIENDYLLLGYGKDINFNGANSKSEIVEFFNNAGYDRKQGDYGVTSVNVFKNKIKAGDIVVISDGNKKFRAIAQVTGDYRFIESEERDHFFQCRDVEWLKVFDNSRPIEELFHKSLSQMTLYELKPKTVKLDVLSAMLADDQANDGVSHEPYVLIIDEINRGNIAKIFGELITLIEPSKRHGAEEALSVRLPYSKDEFSVPSNLYIIGTMNTADRSLAQLDVALRRRFSFEELMPDIGLLSSIPAIDGVDVGLMLDAINTRIELLYDREHNIGHSHFIPLRDDPTLELLAEIFELQVLPLLEEYFFEDWEVIGQVLGDNLKPEGMRFIQPKFSTKKVAKLMGQEWESQNPLQAYKRNTSALAQAEAFIGIYDPSAITEFDA